MRFTYWQEPDGMWLGYMNDYPDNWTQGHTLEELKRMLISLRHDIEGDEQRVADAGSPSAECGTVRDKGILTTDYTDYTD